MTNATPLTLWLRMLDDRRRPRSGAGTASLEYVIGERAYRLTGDLDTPERDGHWRFVPGTPPVFLERREHMRTRLDVAIVLISDERGTRLVGRTRDVSVGGALGDFPAVAQLGEPLRFSLVSRVDPTVIKGSCRVVRSEPPGQIAVSFERLAFRQVEQLADFILRNR